jgi:hypothetical protein
MLIFITYDNRSGCKWATLGRSRHWSTRPSMLNMSHGLAWSTTSTNPHNPSIDPRSTQLTQRTAKRSLHPCPPHSPITPSPSFSAETLGRPSFTQNISGSTQQCSYLGHCFFWIVGHWVGPVKSAPWVMDLRTTISNQQPRAPAPDLNPNHESRTDWTAAPRTRARATPELSIAAAEINPRHDCTTGGQSVPCRKRAEAWEWC